MTWLRDNNTHLNGDKKVGKEHVAWIADDGELTESEGLMKNWKRHGHDFVGLTAEQLDDVNRVHTKIVKRLFPEIKGAGYDVSDMHLDHP